MKKNRLVNGFIQTYGLEFFAVDHCNLKCSGCSQSSPFLRKRFADLSLFERSLAVLTKYLSPQKIKILGGEPLLHPEIDSIISIARNAKMFDKVQITTNGLTLLKMSSSFWAGIDILKISKYPANADFINQHLAEFIKVSDINKVELQIREMDTFNRIILTEEITDSAIVEKIYHTCVYKYFCNALSENDLYRCSPIVNASKYQRAINNSFPVNTHEYLTIEDSATFQACLLDYLNSDIPLNGCKYCLGSSGKAFPHSQLTKVQILNPERYSFNTENYVSH